MHTLVNPTPRATRGAWRHATRATRGPTQIKCAAAARAGLRTRRGPDAGPARERRGTDARRRGGCVYKTNTNSLIETYIKLQFSPARPTSPLASILSYKSNLYAPDRKVESQSC